MLLSRLAARGSPNFAMAAIVIRAFIRKTTQTRIQTQNEDLEIRIRQLRIVIFHLKSRNPKLSFWVW